MKRVQPGDRVRMGPNLHGVVTKVTPARVYVNGVQHDYPGVYVWVLDNEGDETPWAPESLRLVGPRRKVV